MNIKQLQEVYQSTIDWLKFLEAKIIAVLTLESGFFLLYIQDGYISKYELHKNYLLSL